MDGWITVAFGEFEIVIDTHHALCSLTTADRKKQGTNEHEHGATPHVYKASLIRMDHGSVVVLLGVDVVCVRGQRAAHHALVLVVGALAPAFLRCRR